MCVCSYIQANVEQYCDSSLIAKQLRNYTMFKHWFGNQC